VTTGGRRTVTSRLFRPPVAQLFLVSAWFALAAGVLEGTMKTLLRGVPGFVYLNSPDILWIAPAVNLALFVAIAAGLGLALRPWGTVLSTAVIAAFFGWVGFFDLLLTLGKMSPVASLLLSLGLAVQLGRWLRGRDATVLSFFRRTIGPLLILAILAGTAGFKWDHWQERSLVHRLPAAPTGAPNLLLITLDTLRADHLSSYGYARRTSPNIDRLAQQGVLFEHAIANSSWTLPSHASLFTARLPHEHKANWLVPLDSSYPTLAEVLAAQGYVTAAFAANTTYVTPEWGLARGFTHFEVYGSSLSDDIVRTVYGRKLALNLLPRFGDFEIPGRKRASEVNREFLHWLDGTRGRPFFAFLNYLEAHDPYLPPPGYASRFAAPMPRGDLINFQFQPNVFRRKPTLTAEEIQSEVNGYDACLAYLDAQLGQLFQELAARGVDKNTLIVLASDHGEAFGNHDLFGHGNSLYIETLHVPLIMVWPGHIPAGKRIVPTVSLHRLAATILDLLGLWGTPPPLPGKTLRGLWLSDSGDRPGDAVVSEVSPGRFKEGPPSYPTTSGGLTSVVTDRWHFIRSESGRVELYAWREDHDEAHDLAATPAGRVVIRELQGLLPSP
jgi:arylsulfatase A-like enzyme